MDGLSPALGVALEPAEHGGITDPQEGLVRQQRETGLDWVRPGPSPARLAASSTVPP